MSETKPNVPKPPQKIVRRSIAIALGIIGIILIAGLGGAMAYYTMTINNKNDKITALNAQITQLQTWLDGNITAYNAYAADHSNTNEEYSSLQSTITSLTNITKLADSTVWVNDETVTQPASAYTTWICSASYAGYISVWVQSSTVPGTWVEVAYSAYGVTFGQTQVVSVGNTAFFPILPSNITIGVGNGLVLGSGANETVTITYYY